MQFKPLSGMVLKEEKEYVIKFTESSFSNAISFLNKYALILSWKDPSRIKITPKAYQALQEDSFDFKSPSTLKMFQYMAEFPNAQLQESISKQPYLPLEIVKVLETNYPPCFSDIAAFNRNEVVLRYMFTSVKHGIRSKLTANNKTPPDLLESAELNSNEILASNVARNPATKVNHVRILVNYPSHNVHMPAIIRLFESDPQLVVARLNQCIIGCKNSLIKDSDDFNRLIRDLVRAQLVQISLV